MRVLFDTNVIMDFIVDRGNFSTHAHKVISICMGKELDCYIATHTIPNLYYILRKQLSDTERQDILLEICQMFTVVGIDEIKLISALQNNDFTDFEDCLQTECAKDFEANYIVTRNTKDFLFSEVSAIEPIEFVQLLN